MPFIQQEAAGGQFGSLASGMGALASAMFPDPSKIVQARLYNSQAAQADQATSDAQRLAAVRQSLPDMMRLAAQNPNATSLAAVNAAAAQAGVDPKQWMAPNLAANATGGDGTTVLPQAVADRASTLSGTASTFGSTQTGQQVTEGGLNSRLATTERGLNSRLAVTEQGLAARQGVSEQGADRRLGVTEQGLNTRLGVTEGGADRRLGVTEQGADRRQGVTEQGADRRLGVTEGGADRRLAVSEAGALARTNASTLPGLMTAQLAEKKFQGESTPSIVATPGQGSGFSVYNTPAGQQPPQWSVPLNPQQPVLSAPAVPIFQPQPLSGPGTVTPTTAPATSAPNAAVPDPGAPAGPAETHQQQQAADAQAPGVTPHATPASDANPATSGIFSQFAGGALPKPAGDSAGDAIVQNKLIEQYEKAFSAENPGSMIFGHRDYKVSDALRAKINADASRYNTDRGNRITFGNMGPSFEQAWQDNVPKAVRDNAYFGDNSANSYLRLATEKPTTDGTDKNKPGQSLADQAAAAVTPPGSGRQVAPGTGQSLPNGPAVRTQQNAPSIPGLPPPNMRGYGMVYRIPGRGDFIWRGEQGWEAVQGAQ